MINYDKAIEYYLKVTPIKDNVRERIAACYKAKKDYQQAKKVASMVSDLHNANF